MGKYFDDGGTGIDLLLWLCKRRTFYNIVLHTSDPDCWHEMNDVLEQYWSKPKIKIYLDDVRPAPDGYVLCKSVNEAIKTIQSAERDGIIVELLDLDHDMGDYFDDGGDGIKLPDWLCERKTFYPARLHTMNPVGDNMLRVINRFWPKD